MRVYIGWEGQQSISCCGNLAGDDTFVIGQTSGASRQESTGEVQTEWARASSWSLLAWREIADRKTHAQHPHISH
jgi:hypothetical protein